MKFDERKVAINIDEEQENASALAQNRPVWHLPLMVVQEPTKLRICHDAKASVGGVALNDYILGGPNLTNNIATVILLFRIFKYVFTTDISRFFHQVRVDERDKDVFRYPWFKDSTCELEIIERFLSHIFGS